MTTGVLAAASAAIMLAATATLPLLPDNPPRPSTWAHRLVDGRFTRTVVGHGWLGILLFALLVGAAIALAALATGRLPVRRRDLETAVAALAGWLVTLRAAPELLRHDRAGVVAALLLLAAVVVTVLRVLGAGALAALPGLPLLALAVPALPRHPPFALLVLVACLLATAFAERRRLHLRLPRPSDVPARVRS